MEKEGKSQLLSESKNLELFMKEVEPNILKNFSKINEKLEEFSKTYQSPTIKLNCLVQSLDKFEKEIKEVVVKEK